MVLGRGVRGVSTVGLFDNTKPVWVFVSGVSLALVLGYTTPR